MGLTTKEKLHICTMCTASWVCPLTRQKIRSAAHLAGPGCPRWHINYPPEDTTDRLPETLPDKVVLIWAAGSAVRFDGVTKQLLQINGEAIIKRTIRLLRTYHGIEPIVITRKADIKQAIDCWYYTPGNNKWLTDTIVSTRSLWTDRTVCLYGDCMYTHKTLRRILDCRDDLRFFSRKGELVGFTFTPERHRFLLDKCAYVTAEAEKGRARTKGKGWCLFRACAGQSLNDRNVDSPLMVRVQDRTTDIDSAASYNKKLGTKFFSHSSFFETPSAYADGVTAITCTGDRLEAFDLCYRYMERQSRRPDQWIVVDDGDLQLDPQRYPLITDYIRRERVGRQPKHTLARNLRCAVEKIAFDKCVMIEDDDWYHRDYIRLMADVLEREDMVGQRQVIEFNLLHRRYRVKRTTRHSSLCCTAFTWAAYKNLQVIVSANDSMLVDRQLWRSFDGCKKLLANRRPYICVGIKGMPGRMGRSRGHRLKFLPRLDPTGRHLRRLIGGDMINYERFYLP